MNDEEKTAEFVSNVVRIHIAIEEVERERESESSVNESEAVYHHDCDEAYKLSTTSELAYSQRKLDRHALACSLKKVCALRPVIVTRAECTCSYASNETEPVCSSCKHAFAVRVKEKCNNRKKLRLIVC